MRACDCRKETGSLVCKKNFLEFKNLCDSDTDLNCQSRKSAFEQENSDALL